MNYHTDIVNFRGRLLERGAHFENLTFWRGAYLRMGIISFNVVQNDNCL